MSLLVPSPPPTQFLLQGNNIINTRLLVFIIDIIVRTFSRSIVYKTISAFETIDIDGLEKLCFEIDGLDNHNIALNLIYYL